MFTKQVKTLSLHFNQHVEHTLCTVDMKWVRDDGGGGGKMSKRGRRGGGRRRGGGKEWNRREVLGGEGRTDRRSTWNLS